MFFCCFCCCFFGLTNVSFVSVHWKVIGEDALSSGHCRGCRPRYPASVSWQSVAVLRSLKTQTAVTSLFSHSPVPSPELPPPAGLPSHASTSSSCSGTTPSPTGEEGEARQKVSRREQNSHPKIIKKQLGSLTASTATSSRGLAAIPTAAIMCGCSVPSATWRLPVFP